MCLAIPGKIEKILSSDPLLPEALVNFGGLKKKIYLSYTPEAQEGDYILVHVGFSIGRLSEEDLSRLPTIPEDSFPHLNELSLDNPLSNELTLSHPDSNHLPSDNPPLDNQPLDCLPSDELYSDNEAAKKETLEKKTLEKETSEEEIPKQEKIIKARKKEKS